MVPLSVKSAVPLVSLCCLMVITCAAAAAAAGDSRCRTQDKVKATMERPPWSNLSLHFKEKLGMANKTLLSCSEALKQMSANLGARALAPWTYSLDDDPSRIPSRIARAKCLCEGCVINEEETSDYNSVLVSTSLVVLKITPCGNTDSYKLKKVLEDVPVGCTCVRPKSN